MSGQALDLRRSAQIVRRRKALVGVVTALGLVAGAIYTALTSATYLSSAFVSLSPSVSAASQTVVATGPPVLSLALPRMEQGMSLDTLRSRIRARRAAAGLMSVSAVGNTSAQAIETANVVARSYVAYVSSASNLNGPLPAQVLLPATTATGTALPRRLFYAAGRASWPAYCRGHIALAIGRNGSRLRERDEIADSIGVPVLASVRGHRPTKAAGWTKLLGRYEPDAADAWRLRRVLRDWGTAGPRRLDPRRRFLARGAFAGRRPQRFALGPQLAVFAASLGIPATLVVDSQQDARPRPRYALRTPRPRRGDRRTCASPRATTATPAVARGSC